MLVRMKQGKYAGEVQDVKFVTAQDLIASGRAEKAEYLPPREIRAGDKPQTSTQESSTGAKPLSRRGRRKLAKKLKSVN